MRGWLRFDWRAWTPALRLCGWFTLGWLLAALPQLVVNVADTGAPLYSQQAKNIWLAVYGNTDWSRWDEAANDVSLSDVVLADPPRFWSNWSRNLQAFVGTGANDTSEFGQTIDRRPQDLGREHSGARRVIARGGIHVPDLVLSHAPTIAMGVGAVQRFSPHAAQRPGHGAVQRIAVLACPCTA